MEVYVITKGEYSDYHIVGVSLDKTRAQEIAAVVSDKYDDAQVETYNTDDFVTQELRVRFIVEFRFGKWEAYSDTYIFEEIKSNHIFNENKFIIFAPSKDHAIKIAQDMRAKIMAEEAGL